MSSDEPEYQKFIQRALITVMIVILAILVVLAIYYLFDVILLVFAAVLVAIFLRGLADLVSDYTKISEGWSLLLVSLLLVSLLAGSIALLAPSVADQIRLLRDDLPRSIQTVSAYISQFGWGRALMEYMPSTEEAMQKVDASSMLTRLGGYFSTTVGVIGNFLIMILLAVYLAAEPKFYIQGLTKLFPLGRRQRVFEILAAIGEALRWWLIGKAASMLFIGVLTWIGLSIIGVPLSLTLGLIAGLLSFIPNFGPIISALPALLLAFIDSPVKSLYVLGLYVGVQLIESNIVTPLIERETIELPPALTITSQIALGLLIGGLGLILATPLLAAVMVIVQMVYIHDVLGDREIGVSAGQREAEIRRKGAELKQEISQESRE